MYTMFTRRTNAFLSIYGRFKNSYGWIVDEGEGGGEDERAKVHENNSFLDEYSLKNCFKSPRIVSVLFNRLACVLAPRNGETEKFAA